MRRQAGSAAGRPRRSASQETYTVEDHTAAGEQTPAVALNTQADKVYLKNSRIIGRQDTLYV